MPSASPWYASIAGRRVFTAPHAAAVPWSETALMRPKLTGSGIGARHAQGASTTSPARCWPDITSRCGSGCCACTSWALTSRALIEFQGDGGTSHDQSRDEGAKQSFASAPGVMHELEEAEIQRQLLLRDAPVWPQPGA